MIDLSPAFRGEKSFSDVVAPYTREDLRALTIEMIDAQRAAIDGATDDIVTLVPSDPAANDTFAASEADTNISWTLGHVIVHTTASSEESAALALTLARGLPVDGRSRYETPWESVTTIAQVLHRLEESRRMRLSMLDAWPDEPHLDVTYEPYPGLGPLNAVGRFLLGLGHDQDHLGQLKNIMEQARA